MMFGVHVTTIDRWRRLGALPQPAKITRRSVFWDAGAVEAFLRECQDEEVS